MQPLPQIHTHKHMHTEILLIELQLQSRVPSPDVHIKCTCPKLFWLGISAEAAPTSILHFLQGWAGVS